MKNELKTPPPFVRCDECDGDGYILDDCNGNAMLGELPIDTKCSKCADSPLPGWLPQWYTPEQWVGYVRRENDLSDYELPDDMPVWIFDGEWVDNNLLIYVEYYIGNFCIIHNEAGHPPEGYKP